MKVKFDFTVDDLVDSSERAVARSGVARSWRWRGMLGSCALTAAVGYVLVPARPVLAAVVGAVVCGAIYPFSMGRSRKSRLQKYFREQFGGDGPFTCEVELTPAGLVTVQSGARTVRDWSSIVEIQETADSVDFISKGAGSLIVRNRAFRSAEEHDAFVKLARSYAPNSGSGP